MWDLYICRTLCAQRRMRISAKLHLVYSLAVRLQAGREPELTSLWPEMEVGDGENIAGQDGEETRALVTWVWLAVKPLALL